MLNSLALPHAAHFCRGVASLQRFERWPHARHAITAARAPLESCTASVSLKHRPFLISGTTASTSKSRSSASTCRPLAARPSRSCRRPSCTRLGRTGGGGSTNGRRPLPCADRHPCGLVDSTHLVLRLFGRFQRTHRGSRVFSRRFVRRRARCTSTQAAGCPSTLR